MIPRLRSAAGGTSTTAISSLTSCPGIFADSHFVISSLSTIVLLTAQFFVLKSCHQTPPSSAYRISTPISTTPTAAYVILRSLEIRFRSLRPVSQNGVHSLPLPHFTESFSRSFPPTATRVSTTILGSSPYAGPTVVKISRNPPSQLSFTRFSTTPRWLLYSG